MSFNKENRPFQNTTNHSQPNTTQFKYISIWNEYINLLKNNVPLKKHRVGLRYYENTFSGAEAVQTIFSQVKTRPDLFSENTNRRNLSRLCNKLLERGVLERAESNNSQITNGVIDKFIDSKDAIYRISKAYQEPVISSNFSSAINAANMGQIEKDMIRESVRVRLLQLLDINFIDNIVTSPVGKGKFSDSSENSSILQAISSKFGSKDDKLKLNSEISGYEDIGWNEELRVKFEKLVKLSTFDDTDPVLSRGLNLMNDHLIGRNNGLYNALTKFFQHDNQQHQGIELYKLINEYYKFIQKQTGRSLISSKWDEVIRAIGRLMEQIKRIELSHVNEGLNLHMDGIMNRTEMELNASICSFSSTGTQASLVTSQKEVIEASQLFFQLIPEKHRIEIRSMLAFLRVCSCVGGGHLSIDQIVMDYVNIVFDSSHWPNQAYRIHETGEYFNYRK